MTTSHPATTQRPTEAPNRHLVDPRAPRFGQALTAIGLVAGIALEEPALVVAVTAILVTAVLSGWRIDLYGLVWKRLVGPVLDPPAETEAASPHRFAKLMGAGFTTVASLLLVGGVAVGSPTAVVAGYAVAGFVALLAGVAAALDLCVGCRLYRQFAFAQRLGWV